MDDGGERRDECDKAAVWCWWESVHHGGEFMEAQRVVSPKTGTMGTCGWERSARRKIRTLVFGESEWEEIRGGVYERISKCVS